MAQVVRKKQFTYLPEALLETQLMHTPGVELGLFPVVGRPRSADSIAIDRGCDRPHSGRLLTIDQRSAGCLPTPVGATNIYPRGADNTAARRWRQEVDDWGRLP